MNDAGSAGASVFTEAELQLLREVLDAMIPGTSTLMAAGQAGAADHVGRRAAASPALRRRLGEALATIAILAARSHPDGFGALDHDQKETVLQSASTETLDAFEALILHAYSGYYALPRVLAGIGAPDRPPQPLGHEMAPLDERLLARVKLRAPLYRPTPRA
jgi:gluconate 2-dehydrogenase subunit 3-like protein